MTQPLTPSLQQSTRLVQLLSSLTDSPETVSHERFADRLSGMINFSGSLTLVSLHGDLSRIRFEPTGVTPKAITEEFLRVRLEIGQFIGQQFQAETVSTRFKLPALMSTTTAENALNFGTYQRFYAALQAEMDFRLQNLRLEVRGALAGVNSAMAQLAAIDEALNDTLAARTRSLLAEVQNALASRFHYWQQDLSDEVLATDSDETPKEWLEPGQWLANFCQEMHQLLLAELEVRSLPILGLIETINDEPDVN